ncbi:Ypt/Rab-GAP domain of gyp1p superfamily protein [Tanacetum coccineum]
MRGEIHDDRSQSCMTWCQDFTFVIQGFGNVGSRDLPRTFPGYPWLDTPEGHASLRRILIGYSFCDSDIG